MVLSRILVFIPLHQEELEDKYQKHKQENTYSLDLPDFSGSQWDLIRAGSHDQQEISSTPASLCSVEDTCNKINEVMLNLKKQLRQQPPDEQLVSGAKKFVERYAALSQKPALLISALHRFGWVFGGSISSRKFGKIHHGKRITASNSSR